MRVERDFGYGERDSLPLDAPPFVQSELTQLIDHIAKLKPAERVRHLALLGVKSVEALRARLAPRIVLNPSSPLSAPRRGGQGVRTSPERSGGQGVRTSPERSRGQGVRTDSAMRGVGQRARTEKTDTTWVVEVEQPSFDGKTHLWLSLEGDTRETVPAVSGNVVTIRRPAGGAVRWSVRVTTDAAALIPLTRQEIFNDEFQQFAARVRADTAHPLRWRRLEREIRGAELLSYREKLMAGLPNFATYF